MLRHPENDLDVGPVPTVAEMMGEEAPGVIVVLVGEQDAHTVIIYGIRIVVVSPYKT